MVKLCLPCFAATGNDSKAAVFQATFSSLYKIKIFHLRKLTEQQSTQRRPESAGRGLSDVMTHIGSDVSNATGVVPADQGLTELVRAASSSSSGNVCMKLF